MSVFLLALKWLLRMAVAICLIKLILSLRAGPEDDSRVTTSLLIIWTLVEFQNLYPSWGAQDLYDFLFFLTGSTFGFTGLGILPLHIWKRHEELSVILRQRYIKSIMNSRKTLCQKHEYLHSFEKAGIFLWFPHHITLNTLQASDIKFLQDSPSAPRKERIYKAWLKTLRDNNTIEDLTFTWFLKYVVGLRDKFIWYNAQLDKIDAEMRGYGYLLVPSDKPGEEENWVRIGGKDL